MEDMISKLGWSVHPGAALGNCLGGMGLFPSDLGGEGFATGECK